MVEDSKINVKISDLQLNKLKFAAKNQTGVTFGINIKGFNGSNSTHKLLLTVRQKTKLRKAFENNMPADIKLPRAQISKIVQSGGFLGLLLSKLAGPLIKVDVPFGKKYFSYIRNNSCCFSNCRRNSTKNKSFWNSDFNNLK